MGTKFNDLEQPFCALLNYTRLSESTNERKHKLYVTKTWHRDPSI